MSFKVQIICTRQDETENESKAAKVVPIRSNQCCTHKMHLSLNGLILFYLSNKYQIHHLDFTLRVPVCHGLISLKIPPKRLTKFKRGDGGGGYLDFFIAKYRKILPRDINKDTNGDCSNDMSLTE